MSDYYLYCIILKDCPYSENAHLLLNTYKNIKKKINIIEHKDKEKYKTSQIDTFPQIYLVNKKHIELIGGYTELQNIINSIKELYKYINKNKNKDKYTFIDIKKSFNFDSSLSNKCIFNLFKLFNTTFKYAKM